MQNLLELSVEAICDSKRCSISQLANKVETLLAHAQDKGGRIVLVGDVNQLGSVAAGIVFGYAPRRKAASAGYAGVSPRTASRSIWR